VKRLRSLLLFFLPFVIFTYVSLVVFQQACDYAMNVQAEKRLPFNHKTHIHDYSASDCELCHGFYENGRFKGLPTVADCKMCHDGNTAKEKAFFAGFKDTDSPWESFAKQPDLVYFSHAAVMKNSKEARCGSCHGDKEHSNNTEKIQGKMLMGKCMDCHTALKISNTCMVCHD
jgi:menaquinone reductase, multiheme cytochrome c subunit